MKTTTAGPVLCALARVLVPTVAGERRRHRLRSRFRERCDLLLLDHVSEGQPEVAGSALS